MKISLIVSTYNRPEALKVCLESIRRQKTLPMEIVIGDDGSKNETKELIDAIRQDFPVPIKHVWHEDAGFRLAMMRNKAVAACDGDYIIEIDGDVFLHPRFVGDHMHFAQPGYYLKGGRVNLDKAKTEKILRNGRPSYPFFCGVESKRENGLYIPAFTKYYGEKYRQHKSSGLGCNMSFWRADFVAINGYDEFFEGWGGEDIEFAARLLAHGCKKRYLKFSGIIYHLWHEDKFNYNVAKNFDYAHSANKTKGTWCEKGISQYLK